MVFQADAPGRFLAQRPLAWRLQAATATTSARFGVTA
jgi:hypothetical protein